MVFTIVTSVRLCKFTQMSSQQKPCGICWITRDHPKNHRSTLWGRIFSRKRLEKKRVPSSWKKNVEVAEIWNSHEFSIIFHLSVAVNVWNPQSPEKKYPPSPPGSCNISVIKSITSSRLAMRANHFCISLSLLSHLSRMALLGPAKLLQLAAAWASMAYGCLWYIYICVYKWIRNHGYSKATGITFQCLFLDSYRFIYIYMYIRCG